MVPECSEAGNSENLVCEESVDWKLLHWRQTLQ